MFFYSHAAVACQITEQRQDRILMAHRSATVNRLTPLKQIKHNRKKSVQNNASTLLLFVALCEHTTFIVSKQSRCVFSISEGNPHDLSVPTRNTVLKYHTDRIIFSKGTDSLDRHTGGSVTSSNKKKMFSSDERNFKLHLLVF